MARVLIRSGKDPFTAVSAEATLAQNVFHTNVGNYLYTNAVHRALSTAGTEIVSNGTLSELHAPEPGDAERINDRFDGSWCRWPTRSGPRGGAGPRPEPTRHDVPHGPCVRRAKRRLLGS